MSEVRMYREMDDRARQAEQDQMRADAEANARKKKADEEAEEQRLRALKAENLQILDGLAQKRQREKDKKARDAQRMSDWPEDERSRKECEDRERAIEHNAKCKQAREEMQAAQEAAAARKKALQEAERAYVMEQQQRMDDAVAAGRQGIMDRMAQIEKNTATIGKEIAERDAKAERELQEKIRRVQEQSDREAKEDAERRKATRDRNISEMLASLDDQCQKRAEDAVAVKEADRQQAKVWKDQYEEGLAKDRAEAEKRRLARDSLDATLIDQMRVQVAVHPENFGITDKSKNLDVAYNRMMYEQMHKEGFMAETTENMLVDAREKEARKKEIALAHATPYSATCGSQDV